jgi:hypothetical protein
MLMMDKVMNMDMDMREMNYVLLNKIVHQMSDDDDDDMYYVEENLCIVVEDQ